MAPKYKLTYFNAQGKAEVIRFIFVVAGVEYEDFRIPFDDFKDAKKDLPFLQIPVLNVEGQDSPLCQTMGICNYLTRELDVLNAKNSWDQVRLDMIAGCVMDQRLPVPQIIFETDPDLKEKKRKTYEENTAIWLSKLDFMIFDGREDALWSVGDSMTWVDCMIATYLVPFLFEKVNVKFPIDEHPRIQALIKRVEEHPLIADWIDRRPETPI